MSESPRSRNKERQEPLLFDLPLQSDEVADSPPRVAPEQPEVEQPPEVVEAPAAVEQPSLFAEVEDSVAPEEAPEDSATEPTPRDQVRAGLFDLVLQLANVFVAVGFVLNLGVELTSSDWAPFAVLAFVASFLYWNVTLVFWGRTPGMAWAGLIARDVDGEPLAFGQAMRRWLAAVVTTCLVGLPWVALLVSDGRSIVDRISSSTTSIDS